MKRYVLPALGGLPILVKERRPIVQAWGDYLAMAEADNVVPLRTKASTQSG